MVQRTAADGGGGDGAGEGRFEARGVECARGQCRGMEVAMVLPRCWLVP